MEINIETKKKENEIQSAFIKGNTLMLMLSFFPKNDEAKRVISNQKIKIKFEVDVDNPSGGTTQIKYRMLPSPYAVRIFDEPTLFAGKIHAILCRNYKHHVKGRDYYDYLFYIGKGTKFNLKYLENKLKNSNKIDNKVSLSLDMVKDMLKEKFLNADYESAKEDVSNFIEDKRSVDLWKHDLFVSTLESLSNQ